MGNTFIESQPAMIVRDASIDDLPQILAIYNDVIATSTAVYSEVPETLDNRRSWFLIRRSQGYPILVAIDNSEDLAGGNVIGFSTFGDFRPWPCYRHTVEHSVYVHAHWRGRGAGNALMQKLVQRAGELGKHVMIAGVDAANDGSIRFHERLGFDRVGHLRQVGAKFGRWLDLVFLQRVLDTRAAPIQPTA